MSASSRPSHRPIRHWLRVSSSVVAVLVVWPHPALAGPGGEAGRDRVLRAGAGASMPGGSRRVRQVQRLFGVLGYPLGDEARSGVFGPRTAGAVRYFQRKYRLEETGAVGPGTLQRIRDEVRREARGANAPPGSGGSLSLTGREPEIGAAVLVLLLGLMILLPMPRRQRESEARPPPLRAVHDASELLPALDGTRRDTRLGALLQQLGELRPSDLDEALDIQRASGGRLGRILVATGAARPGAVTAALAHQHAVPLAAPGDRPATGALDRETARRLGAVALEADGADSSELVVAVADLEPATLEELARVAERTVSPRLVDDASLSALLRAAYRARDEADVTTAVRAIRPTAPRARHVLVAAAIVAAAVALATAPVLGAGVAAVAMTAVQLRTARRRRMSRPPEGAPRDGHQPPCSVIVPLRNASAAAISRCVAMLGALDHPPHRLEGLALVGQDDESTLSAIGKVQLPPWLQVVQVPGRRRTRRWLSVYGVRVARGRVAVVVDAGRPPGPHDLQAAASALLDHDMRFVSVGDEPTALGDVAEALSLVGRRPLHRALTGRSRGSAHVDVSAATAALGWPTGAATPDGGPWLPRSIWVCVPTYNEAGQVEPLVREVLAAMSGVEADTTVLVIDDASPDGTGAVAARMARADPRVRVLHRPRKEGIGPAYQAGFRKALDEGADLVMQMDCDFSHDPRRLPALVRAAEDAHLVLGSRYVPGGRVAGWGLGRRVISRGGCSYARALLGVPVRDLTGGFKAWRREVLEALPLEAVTIRGYGFQVEMTYRALRAGFRIAEIPIAFTERRSGASKRSPHIALEAALAVPRMRAAAARRRALAERARTQVDGDPSRAHDGRSGDLARMST